MNKLSFLVRSSRFRYYYSYLTTTAPTTTTTTLLNLPNSKPYFRIPTLPFSTTIATEATTRKAVATYLIESLGFSEEQSLALSKKLKRLVKDPRAKQVQVNNNDLFSFENSDNVITFLHQHCGLNSYRVKRLIRNHPRVLTVADVDKTLKPKVKLLRDLGFSTSDLAPCLSGDPVWYLETDLTPVIQALRGILVNDNDIVSVFKGLRNASANSIFNNLIPNVTMLENEYGISKKRVRVFLCTQPLVLMLKTKKIRDGIVKVEDKWGITRDSKEFFGALAVFCSFSDDNINSKCQVFRSYGWSDSDILSLIRGFPTCLGYSKAIIKKKLDFYMNECGYKPAFLASRPAVMGLSLVNTVFRRHRILSVLKEKGFIKEDFQHDIALFLNEDKFIERFILPNGKIVHELLQVYIDGGRARSKADVHMETSEMQEQHLLLLNDTGSMNGHKIKARQ